MGRQDRGSKDEKEEGKMKGRTTEERQKGGHERTEAGGIGEKRTLEKTGKGNGKTGKRQ